MESTPRACSIVERTREVIAAIDQEILPNPSFDPTCTRKTFTFCTSEIGEMVFLPTIFDRVRSAAPHASIHCVSLSANDLLDGLREGSVDCALGYFPDLDAPNIYQQRLFSHDLVWLIGRHHGVTGPQLSLEEFCTLEHVQVRDGNRSQEMYESLLAERGIERKIVLQISHYMSMPAIIERSNLTAVLPRSVAHIYEKHAAVRIIEPPVGIPTYSLKHHWHAWNQKDPQHVCLRKVLVGIFTAPN